jgi:LPS-assembly lipoprotein
MRALILIFVLLLSACGFQLRGSYDLPWATMHLNLPQHGAMYAQLKRGIEAGSATRIVNDPKTAQASLLIVNDHQAKNILSLSGSGLVREFQLTRTLSYRLVDAQGRDLQPPGHLLLQREMTFDDQQILAKEAEEEMIWQEMQNDLVQQLLRRLSAAKPHTQR